MKSILVTGGTGYIGSHTVVELLDLGYHVTIVDNLCNSSQEVLHRIHEITGKQPSFYQLDIRDKQKLQTVFEQQNYDAVIHFAGLKAVGESSKDPLLYYDNNVNGIITLLDVMHSTGTKTLIFSSTACVYGDQPVPYTEHTARSPQNPYGNTKYVSELLMEDFAKANPDFTMIALRYFNPIGAHPSGRIGEDPNGVPNNLMPYVAQVATGKRTELAVFGNDYPTPDGTGVRDYIHVVDLAKGHIAALENAPRTGFSAYNLGSGHGESVLQLVRAFESASGVTIPYTIAPRRPGDLAEYYADASLAQKELGWHTTLSLEQACEDTWNWQSQNPNGYKE